MLCSAATCFQGQCKAGSCVCNHGWFGVNCHESATIESKTPLYLAFRGIIITLYTLTFAIIFFQLLRALLFSVRKRRCTAVPKRLCLAFLSVSTLVGLINYQDPWGYRGTMRTETKLFLSQIIVITTLLGSYPMWRMWFKLLQVFDHSRFLAAQPIFALVLLIALATCNIIVLIFTFSSLSYVKAQSIVNSGIVVVLAYFMTVPAYCGWKIMKQMDQNNSKKEVRHMGILVMGCSTLFFFEFVLNIVQAILLPRVVAYTRTRVILGLFIIPIWLFEDLLVTWILSRHSDEEVKQHKLEGKRGRRPKVHPLPKTPVSNPIGIVARDPLGSPRWPTTDSNRPDLRASSTIHTHNLTETNFIQSMATLHNHNHPVHGKPPMTILSDFEVARAPGTSHNPTTERGSSSSEETTREDAHHRANHLEIRTSSSDNADLNLNLEIRASSIDSPHCISPKVRDSIDINPELQPLRIIHSDNLQDS